jgi:uncharacterized membrane protein
LPRRKALALQVAIAAPAAFVVVVLAGSLPHKPLAFVPENFMKFVVGAMLTTFGISGALKARWSLARAMPPCLILAGVADEFRRGARAGPGRPRAGRHPISS